MSSSDLLSQISPKQNEPNSYRMAILLTLAIAHFNQPYPRSMSFREAGNDEMAYPTEWSMYSSVTLIRVVMLLCLVIVVSVSEVRTLNIMTVMRILVVVASTLMMHSPIFKDDAYVARMSKMVYFKVCQTTLLWDFLTDLILRAMGASRENASYSENVREIGIAFLMTAAMHLPEMTHAEEVPKVPYPRVEVQWSREPEVEAGADAAAAATTDEAAAPSVPAPAVPEGAAGAAADAAAAQTAVVQSPVMKFLTTYLPGMALLASAVVFKTPLKVVEDGADGQDMIKGLGDAITDTMGVFGESSKKTEPASPVVPAPVQPPSPVAPAAVSAVPASPVVAAAPADAVPVSPSN